FDLYKVPIFMRSQLSLLRVDPGAAGYEGVDPGLASGDLTPGWTDPLLPDNPNRKDNVRFDFEEQYLLMNRISNMITTRSDSFTVYVLVQGWRGAGTSNPELVVQRRRAFIADRSGITQ